MKQICTLALILAICHVTAVAQVGINTDASTPDTSAMLDIKSNTKGMLIPRMTSVQRAAIKNPAKGLLVYDSSTTSFWYHNGAAWNELTGGGASGWNLTGNTNVNPADNFIGTKDKTPLVFKINNTAAGRLDTSSNTSYGFAALASTHVGRNLVAIGDSALFNQTTNSNGQYENTAVGSNALFSNTSGYGNTAVGHKAMYTNGSGAIVANDEGTRNTAVGDQALYANTKGLYNTAVGYQSMLANTSGYFNSGFGYGTLGANTSGINNTAIGLVAMAYNTSGSLNTAVGARALQNNTSGYSNIAIGGYALYNNIVANNLIGIGDSTLFNQQTNRVGFYGNIAIGTKTLYANTFGTNNTGTGYNALVSNTTGAGNTANGSFSLRYNTTGDRNTSVGSNTLNLNSTGAYLTAMGYGANVSVDNLTNATAIGANATVAQSNSLVLGSIAGQNTATSSTKVGIGVAAPLAPLHIHSANADNWTNAKTLYLDDDNSLPSIHFQGSGAYAARWWNMTMEPYTSASGNAATAIVLSNNAGYPQVRFQQGSTTFAGDALIEGDARVSGSMYLSGAIHYSDIRLKKDIQPLQKVLPDLLKLKGYTYYWKANKDSALQMGVLAQEVQKVFPNLVKADANGILGVNYVELIPVLLTAIKEQQQQIDELTERIAKIEAMLKEK